MKSMNMLNFTYNKVIIAGMVSTAPVLKEVSADHCICFFEVATNSVRGKREYNNNHRVVCYGKMARNIYSTVKVSDIILVEGELIYREASSSVGAVRQFAEINAFSSRLLLPGVEEHSQDLTPKKRDFLDHFDDEF